MAELLHLDLQGVQGAIEKFSAMAKRAEDLSPVWEAGHDIFVTEMAEQFQTQGTFLLGEQWAPLNPKYLEKKLRKWGDPPGSFGILYRSGNLYSSLVNDTHPEHIKVIEPGGAIYGSSVDYGLYHQTGAIIHAADGGSWRLPQRKIIHVTARTSRWVTRLAVLYITKGRRAAVHGSSVQFFDTE